MEETKTKKCIKCGDPKLLDDFTKSAKSPDGRGSYCKVCHRAYTKKWVSDNKPRVRAVRKAHDDANRDKVRAWQKKYRAEHSEYFSEKQKQHVAENPEKYVVYEARKRAKKFNLDCTITPEDIVIPEFCPILGLKLERGKVDKNRDNTPSLDRIVPEIGYIPSNVAIISYRANRIKNNGTAEEHRRIADWMDAQNPSNKEFNVIDKDLIELGQELGQGMIDSVRKAVAEAVSRVDAFNEGRLPADGLWNLSVPVEEAA